VPRKSSAAAETTIDNQNEPLINLQDPELINAMEIFANMNPEEMEETMEAVKQMLGDDPEVIDAVDAVLKEIQKTKSATYVKTSLKDLIEEDEVAVATNDALKLLGKADAWETVWEKRQEILEAVVKSGQISSQDALRFQNDAAAWEAELQHIWSELEKESARRIEYVSA
jgi:hypothetical protein